MHTQTLLNLLTEQGSEGPIVNASAFIQFLRTSPITSSDDPFVRLVHSALRAGSQSNAGIAGHQAAVRRLFPRTPTDAITSFCVSEKRGPHPRYIETQLESVDGQWQVSGAKMWGTMAPPATLIYVAASTGVVEGQNQLKMVGVCGDASGITQVPLPPERQAGDVPICDLRFAATPVQEDHIYDEDAYETYIKPFRLVEDVFSAVATQIALFRLGRDAGLTHEQREDLLALIVQGHAVAESTMSAPGDLLLITSYLRSSQLFWGSLEGGFATASAAVRKCWDVGRPILTVAARAREQRRQNAWQALGEPITTG